MQGMIWSRAQRTLRNVSGAGFWGAAALGLVLSASALIAPAQATPLEIGNSVTVGSYTFTVTACAFSGETGNCTGSEANLVSSGTNAAPGILITGNGGPLVSNPGTNHDLSVVFSAAGPGIDGVSLGISGTGAGYAQETVFQPSSGMQLGSGLSVSAGGTTLDTIAFAAQSVVTLSKDITTLNGGSVTSITQTLSIASVPEPASIGLFLFGLLTLAGFRSTAVRDVLRSIRRQGSAIG